MLPHGRFVFFFSHGVLCPDWIKWAGIPENVFSFMLHEQGRRDMGYRPNTITVITAGIQSC